MFIDTQKGIVEVFKAFNQDAAQPFPYPQDNIKPFEEWYCESYRREDYRERLYLPIFWTGYYIRAKYGGDKAAIQHLQGYLNALDKSRKYYTIVQYDDGILNDISHLDIRVFSMSGPPVHYPLPLICQPHKYLFDESRNYMFSFAGRPTHPFREKILKELVDYDNAYVSSQRLSMEDYCRLLSKSVFALCPRGHGPTSFRIMEALQYGAIPVYITDAPIIGHHHHFPGVVFIDKTDLFDPHDLVNQLLSLKKEVPNIQYNISKSFETYYTFEGTKRLILENLIHEDAGNHRSRAN